jgi:copper resistance protein B
LWCGFATLLVAAIAHADQPPDSSDRHVPPEPPQHAMGDMSYGEMVSMMQMDDTHRFGKMLLDHVEWRDSEEGSAGAWDVQGWYGGDYDKIWLKTEGERVAGQTRDARAELLWDRVVTRWWDMQAGVREDFGEGPPRTWFAFGLEGLAPYWLDAEATVYVGEQGRTAARVRAEYDLLLTQRLIIQPHGEINLYGKADPQRQIGSGLSDLDLSLRLRYEIRRELAPYVGMVWSRRFGGTADQVRAAGGSTNDLQLVVGARIWF